MKRLILLILALCLLLGGCSSLLDGSYVSVKPHQEQSSQTASQSVAVSSFSGLCRALENMVQNGTVNGVISVANYNQLIVARDMDAAVQKTLTEYPIGAYAVEDIQFELGTNAGKPAIAVDIRYFHDRSDLQKIHHVDKMQAAEEVIAQALTNCDSGLVLYIGRFEDRDFAQWVDDYGDLNPDKVMEIPQVTANLYPETGSSRVVELKFTYQNSRETLRAMQSQVEDLFSDAESGVRDLTEPLEQYKEIYAYLTSLLEAYQVETSITPAYSLLIHGVGDASAFATVYSAMCRRLGLECITVTGTRSGQPWNWNILCLDGVYYHLDVLRSMETGSFRTYTDEAFSGYVWDYAAYPACGVPPTEEPQETDPE
ncbi:MAG: transglutaminase-like domain-containing protein [Firmicutes bacterium]|nr:transglutaminase-like domain-containing protein [Bacillota bacterium]